jgi:Rrf2 family protein
MQLTRAADYAVRVMLHLASQPEGAVISKSMLAQASETPESFLSKVLQAMARAGLIQARRGVVGGFTLLPRGQQASMLDVVESIDGPIALNICLNSSDCCELAEGCAARQVWAEAQAAMVSVLRRAKIAEMAAGGSTCGLTVKIAEAARNSGPQAAKPRSAGKRSPAATTSRKTKRAAKPKRRTRS